MESNNQDGKLIIGAVAVGLGAYFIYRVCKGDEPAKAASKTIDKPVEVVEKSLEAVEKVTKTGIKYFKKGSQEAKDFMANLRSMRKGDKRKKKGKKTSKKKSNPKKSSNPKP